MSNKETVPGSLETDLLKAIVIAETDYDLETGEHKKITVTAEEAVSDAEFIRNSTHFRRALQTLDDKYTNALKYGDPVTDTHYHTYAERLRGLKELVNLLFKPLIQN